MVTIIIPSCDFMARQKWVYYYY